MIEIILGGAQFGMLYGASNTQTDPITVSEAENILDYAKLNNIKMIDTACSYGASESKLGAVMDKNGHSDLGVITKTPPFYSVTQITHDELDKIESTFLNSLRNLNQKKIYGLLVHHADDLLKPGGKDIYDLLIRLKNQGLVSKIGSSFYHKKQIEMVLDRFTLDLIQVPASIFDQRLIKNNYLHELSKFIEVHTRSVFLQGLIFLDENSLPANIAHVAVNYLRCLKKTCNDNNISILELALSYFINKDYLKLVIGVTSQAELSAIIAAINNISLYNLRSIDYDAFSVDDETMLNPSLWEKRQ